MLLNETFAATSSPLMNEDRVSYEEDEGTFAYYANDRLFLRLRYYARHFIPVFCVVGILGNCMALMLIRSVIFTHSLSIKS